MNTKNSDLSKQTSRTERPRGGTTNSNEESEIARNECESMHHSEAHDSTKVKVDRTERQRRYGAEIPALTEPSNAADIQEKTSTSDTLTQGPDYKHQVQSEVHGRRGEHAIEEVPYLSTHQDLRRLHVQEEVGLDLQYTRAEGLEQQLITSDERSIAGAPLVSAHLVEEESRMIVEAVPMPRTEECHPDSTSPSSSKGDHEHTASPSRISSKLLPAAVVGANLVVGGIVVAGVCGSGHCSSHGSPTFLLSGVSDEGQQPLCDTSFVIWATCLRARPTACYNKCQKLGVVEFDYTCDDYESRYCERASCCCSGEGYLGAYRLCVEASSDCVTPNDCEAGGLTGGQIAGIVIGSVVGVVLIGCLMRYSVSRHNKQMARQKSGAAKHSI